MMEVNSETVILKQNEKTVSPAGQLRRLLNQDGIIPMAACFDALSAKLIQAAGFQATFMSGFGVSATRLGLPDTGLISYGELVDSGRNICSAVSIPVLGDGDTGFGNEMNVKRTVDGYRQAGFACVMIEDQLMPKRCGHTAGKAVVDRDQALRRIQAAVDARNRMGDILIMARTDARASLGLEEAIWRSQAFYDLGADITFLEAPLNEMEMRTYCENVPGPKLANLVENGQTPLLPIQDLQDMGYKLAVYALTLLNASIFAMQTALACLKRGERFPGLMDFNKLQQIVGFKDYDDQLSRYQKIE